MRLVRAGRVVWDVLLVTDESGGNVRSFLAGIDPSFKHTETMVAMLETTVPRDGPSKNPLRTGSLGDDIFEFKAGPDSGKKLRVLWFYDAGRIIVCTHAFMKGTRRTPPIEKQRARKLREAYLSAKASSSIRID